MKMEAMDTAVILEDMVTSEDIQEEVILQEAMEDSLKAYLEDS
jgi:hypothetical protein